jgi:hypothetical protein
MAIVIGGVLCQELVVGNSENAGAQGLVADKRVICNYTDRYKVANALLVIASANATGQPILFSNPAHYPESPNLIPKNVHIEGVGSPSQGPLAITFPYAMISITYGVFNWDAFPTDDPTGMNSFGPAMVYATQKLELGFETRMMDGECNLSFLNSGNPRALDAFPGRHRCLGLRRLRLAPGAARSGSRQGRLTAYNARRAFVAPDVRSPLGRGLGSVPGSRPGPSDGSLNWWVGSAGGPSL